MHFAFCRGSKMKKSRIPSMIGEYGFFFCRGESMGLPGAFAAAMV